MSSPLVHGSMALHAAALPALALFPARWPWVLGALAADHLALVAAGLLPRAGLLGPNLTRDSAAASKKAVALSFDDGPDTEVTPRVLDLLDAHGARASFFCIGSSVSRNPALASEIARRGHRVENHTQSHRSGFFFHSPETLAREIGECQDAIASAVGRAPTLFRAPAGIRSPLLAPALAEAGLTLCSWTRRGFDTVRSDPGRIARNLTRGLRPGDVLVLHDGSLGRRDDHGQVLLEALSRVLAGARAAGLAVGPISG